MQNNIKYVHTNIVAKNWKNLANFYIQVFGCKPIHPERNLSGDWLDRLTILNDIKIQGIHLSLPGYEYGPTLEIFEYVPASSNDNQNHINKLGFGHIAFHVDNVKAMVSKIIEHKGEIFSEIVENKYAELESILTVAYVKDPEGNFIELQNWCKIHDNA